MGPQSRNEQDLAKIAGENADLPEFPQSRTEQYLAKIAGEDVEVPEHPQSRAEEYLAVIAEGGGGGGDVDVEPLSVTENGTYTAPTGKAYSPVNVSVPNSYAAGDEGKVVSNGALVSQTSKNITANGTVDTTTNNEVVVAVPNSYTAGDEGKVVSNGALVAQTSDTVTQNGTVDTTLINSLLVNVSGGGGASNVVTGTFKGTTTGAAMDIDLPYAGSGYPLACMIYPSAGNAAGSPFGDLIQAYAIGFFAFVRNAPTYSAIPASGIVECVYKTNSSAATAYTRNGSFAVSCYNDSAASGSYSGAAKIRSATKMSVYIASNSYGFAANIEYTYHVIYSS